MENLDRLRIPPDTRRYIKETINPVLEEIVTNLLTDRPSDPARYIFEWLSVRLNISNPCVNVCKIVH